MIWVFKCNSGYFAFGGLSRCISLISIAGLVLKSHLCSWKEKLELIRTGVLRYVAVHKAHVTIMCYIRLFIWQWCPCLFIPDIYLLLQSKSHHRSPYRHTFSLFIVTYQPIEKKTFQIRVMHLTETYIAFCLRTFGGKWQNSFRSCVQYEHWPWIGINVDICSTGTRRCAEVRNIYRQSAR